MKTVIILLLLLTTAILLGSDLKKVSATHDPTDFNLKAIVWGWNSTSTRNYCWLDGPNGTSTCNPLVVEFRGDRFTVRMTWGEPHNTAIFAHNFAVYPDGFLPGFVYPGGFGPVAPPSADITEANQIVSYTFTPGLPADDFTGVKYYEFYCQWHPESMHGRFKLYKSPDINRDTIVRILDAAALAAAFDTGPGDAKWNVASDLDNDGRIAILDAALLAFYFDKVLVD